MNVFELTSVSWWSGDCVVTCNGIALAKMRFGNWKTTGVITIGDSDYSVSGDGIFGDSLRLQSGDTVLCQTRIHGFWNQSADLVLEGTAYRLKWGSWNSRVVLEKDEKQIGEVEPMELFSRGQRAVFPEDLSPTLSLFILWLVAYKRQRDSAVAV